MPAEVRAQRDKLAKMSPEEIHQRFWTLWKENPHLHAKFGTPQEMAVDAARRHGYGMGSRFYSQHVRDTEM